MKKLYTENKYIKYNKRSALKKWKRKLKHKSWEKNKRKRLQGLSKAEIKEINKFKDYVSVKTPESFSFIGNPNETIEFINKIEKLFHKRKKTFINISKLMN